MHFATKTHSSTRSTCSGASSAHAREPTGTGALKVFRVADQSAEWEHLPGSSTLTMSYTKHKLDWTELYDTDRQSNNRHLFVPFFFFLFFHHHNSPDKSQHLWSEKKQREESYCCSVERNRRLIVKLSSSYTVFKSIYTMYRTDKLHTVYI